MAMAYHRVFKVPVWIVLEKMTKGRRATILEWMASAEARVQEWPAQSYPKALYEYRNKGYAHALPTGKFTLDTQLLVRSAAEHIKTVLGPTSYLGGSVSQPTNRLDRTVEKDDDLVTIFNDLLSLEDPISLSQIFQVAEKCHRDDIKISRVWVTNGPVPKNLLTRIADRVITIGDEANNDVVVDGLKEDQVFERLDKVFTTLFSK